eukprot:293295-Prymnesium_polylepis.1
MRSVPLRIFMGERALAADNIHLGDATIVLTGDAPVEVVIDIDANDVVRVTQQQTVAQRALGTMQQLRENMAAAEANADADRTRRRALLEELGVSEAAFLGVAGAYQPGEAIVLDSLP